MFTNAFAYNEDPMGTRCASIMMREENTGIRRADRSTAVLSAHPRQDFDGDAQRVTRNTRTD